ncbi:hypothetical protein ACFQL4_12845 [Halosimplex aquaticum]
MIPDGILERIELLYFDPRSCRVTALPVAFRRDQFEFRFRLDVFSRVALAPVVDDYCEPSGRDVDFAAGSLADILLCEVEIVVGDLAVVPAEISS